MPYKNPEDQRACSKRHYHANKAIYVARAKAWTLAKKADAKAFLCWLKEQPCRDCGSCFPPICMDFDHLRDKKFNISEAMTGNWTWMAPERLWAEVQKCEVVCSNCHRLRTEARRLAT